MFKTFLKIFGRVFLAFIIVAGCVVGGMAIAGRFKAPDIELTGLSFDSGDYYIDSKTYIQAKSTPMDSTHNDCTIKIISGEQYVTMPSNITANKLFEVTPKKVDGKNIGGVVKFIAKSSNELVFSQICTIYIDVPVSYITVESNQAEEVISGNKFNVNMQYYPTKSETPYIDDINYDYSNKTKLLENTYESTDSNVATVDRVTGEVTAVRAGTFSIKASCFKTFADKENYLEAKAEGKFENNAFAGEEGLDEEEYLSNIILENSKTFTVRNAKLVSLEVETPQNESYTKEIYLYETISYTPEELGLKLNPEKASNLTYEDMYGLYSEVEATCINKNSEDNSEAITIEKNYDENSVFTGWSLTALKYEDYAVNKTAIEFSVTNEDGSVVKTVENLPIKIVKNDISSEENSFTLLNSDAEIGNEYSKLIKFYEYAEESGISNYYENFYLDANIYYSNEDKPKYMAIRYFVKDTEAASGIINFESEDTTDVDGNYHEKGEIIDGYINIIAAGIVNVTAKAIEVDINGDPVLFNDQYTIMAVANANKPLEITVKQMLTGVDIHIDSENALGTFETIDGTTNISNDYDITLIEQQPELRINIASLLDGQKELINEWFNPENDYLEFISSNSERVAVAANIVTEENIETLVVSLYPRKLDYNDTDLSTTSGDQKIARNLFVTIQLTEKAREIYGNQFDNFQDYSLMFDIKTARVISIDLSTNATSADNIQYNDISVQNPENKYLLIYAAGSWITSESKNVEVVSVFTPNKAIDPTFKITSSNDNLLQIDKTVQDGDGERTEDENGNWKYTYSEIFNFNAPSLSALSGALIGEVTVTFTSNDFTLSTDTGEGEEVHGVYNSITFVLYNAIVAD